MPRKLRVEYPGAIYHVMSRGNRRQDSFLDDVDRHDFLKTLAEACQKTGWHVQAYCLIRGIATRNSRSQRGANDRPRVAAAGLERK